MHRVLTEQELTFIFQVTSLLIVFLIATNKEGGWK